MMEENIKKESFYVLRGYLACLKAGARMALLQLKHYKAHFGVISLVMVVLTAYVGGGEKMVSVPAFYETIPVYPVWKLVVYGIALCVLLACWFVWKGRYYTLAAYMLAEGEVPAKSKEGWAKETRTNALRYLQFWVLAGIVVGLFGYGVWMLATHAWVVFCWSLLVLIPVVVYVLPLFSLMETYYMVEDISFRKAVRLAFTDGTRNWGRVMLVYLGSRLGAAVGVCATGLQAVVVSFIIWSSHRAMALGDEVNVPFYLYGLEYVAWAIACIGTLLSSWFRLVPVLYEYGSLVVYHRERDAYKQQQKAMADEAEQMRALFRNTK